MHVLKSFRYRPINKFLWDSLEKSELYFSTPGQLNDPSDCQLDLLSTIARAANAARCRRKQTLQSLLRSKSLLTRIQMDMLGFGVCCFSRTVLSTVMWSHYASAHEGVCLYYEIPDHFILDPTNKIFGYSPVKYGDDALFDWLIKDRALRELSDLDTAMEIMKRALTVKGDDWAYEQEARFIRPLPGAMKLDPGFLKQVCFGLRTADSTKESLRKLISSTYTNITFAEIRHKGEKDFGIWIYDA